MVNENWLPLSRPVQTFPADCLGQRRSFTWPLPLGFFYWFPCVWLSRPVYISALLGMADPHPYECAGRSYLCCSTYQAFPVLLSPVNNKAQNPSFLHLMWWGPLLPKFTRITMFPTEGAIQLPWKKRWVCHCHQGNANPPLAQWSQT